MEPELSRARSQSDGEDWTDIIRPRRKLFDLRLGELWRYRDLMSLFVWRNFTAIYRQTLLGPIWYLVRPLLTTITLTVVFGNIAGLPTDGRPQFLFYMAGTVIWSYFAACLNNTANTFGQNAGIFSKVYFPRLTIPLSLLISNLIGFSIQFVLFLGFVAYFVLSGANVQPNKWVLITPVLLLIMAGLGLGLGTIISTLTSKYRDLQNLLGFGTQLLMFATPVIYPISSVPDNYRWLILANPITPIVETFRFAFLGAGQLDPAHLLYSVVVMAAILFSGILIFNKAEQTFLDTV